MTNFQVAELLRHISLFLQFVEENPFKSQAYERAADAIERMEESIMAVHSRGELRLISGIGESIAATIAEFIETGSSFLYEELRREVPEQLPLLLRVEGLGIKRIKILREKLGITGILDLREACAEGKLSALHGFGPQVQRRILKSIAFLEEQEGYFLIADLLPVASEYLSYISEAPGCITVEMAGHFRRRLDVLDEIVYVVSAENTGEVIRHASLIKDIDYIVEMNSNLLLADLVFGPRICVEAATPENFASMLLHLTGSIEHLIKLSKRASQRGLKLAPEGLLKNGERLIHGTEEAIYRELGLQYIEPELRNGTDEIELAAECKIPRLVELGDIKGVIHAHTTYSDGAHDILQLVEAARREGYQYLGVCDHSKAASYARGLDENRLLEQMEEIDALNVELNDFRILKGIECDILEDGSLDLDEKVLEKLDFVVASVHSHLRMEERKMTERLVKAIENPLVSILGHPTGRLHLARMPSEFDIDKILEAAADSNTIIELNANPHRLDLGYPYLRRAKDMGIKISIDPDAHSQDRIYDITYGVMAARRNMISKDEVVNALSVEDFLKAARIKRGA